MFIVVLNSRLYIFLSSMSLRIHSRTHARGRKERALFMSPHVYAIPRTTFRIELPHGSTMTAEPD